MTEEQKALPAPKEKTCFVVMPIADMTGYDAGHFTRVYEDLIIPACNKAGFKADRADDVKNTTLIHSTILNRLIKADMVVCDLSGKNPNVMFELGIRQAFDKPVTLIKDETTNGIFDVDPLKYTTYSKNLKYNNVVKSQVEIAESIRSTFDSKDDPNTINSIIKLLSIDKPAHLKPTGDASHDMLLVMMSKINSIENKLNFKQNNLLDNNTPASVINNSAIVLADLRKLRFILLSIINNKSLNDRNKMDEIKSIRDRANDIVKSQLDPSEEILDIINDIENIVVEFNLFG